MTYAEDLSICRLRTQVPTSYLSFPTFVPSLGGLHGRDNRAGRLRSTSAGEHSARLSDYLCMAYKCSTPAPCAAWPVHQLLSSPSWRPRSCPPPKTHHPRAASVAGQEIRIRRQCINSSSFQQSAPSCWLPAHTSLPPRAPALLGFFHALAARDLGIERRLDPPKLAPALRKHGSHSGPEALASHQVPARVQPEG